MIPQFNLLTLQNNYQYSQQIQVVKEETKPVYTVPKPAPEPVKYTVVDGDNLTKIGEQNNSSWLRLWQKNTDIANPDLINVGQVLIIPLPEEAPETDHSPYQYPRRSYP